jgi:hypothetical protein
MVARTGKKWRLILSAFLALSVLGTFSFASAGNLQCDGLLAEQPVSAAHIDSLKHAIDWLVSDAAVIAHSGRASFSSLRSGALRVFMPVGPPAAVVFIASSSLNSIIKNQIAVIETAAPLKLRI